MTDGGRFKRPPLSSNISDPIFNTVVPTVNTHSDHITRLAAIVGETGIIAGDAVREQTSSMTRPTEPCSAAMIVKPRSTADVSKILAYCNEVGLAVVPRAGMTGLVDGGYCRQGEVGLSVERMNAIEEFDDRSATMTVQAGTILETAQRHAAERGFLLATDIGARGSAQIGGIVSTNAGGLKVVRYGPTRDQVLGLEAVLADGTVVSSLTRVVKNNTGLDLKQLFIGTEGTLGIITRVVFHLEPLPKVYRTAFIGCPSFDAVAVLLSHARRSIGGTLASFEVMWPEFYKLMTEPGRNAPPIGRDHPIYVLCEAEMEDEAGAVLFDKLLEDAFEQGLIEDAAVAASEDQRRRLWAIREAVEYLIALDPHFTYDVSVPVCHMADYVSSVRSGLAAIYPETLCFAYGHVGDGNLHFTVHAPPEKLTHDQADAVIFPPLGPLHGSISAEHGIGLTKKSSLHFTRSDDEIATMRAVKRALDPKWTLNPGKIFDQV